MIGSRSLKWAMMTAIVTLMAYATGPFGYGAIALEPENPNRDKSGTTGGKKSTTLRNPLLFQRLRSVFLCMRRGGDSDLPFP